MPEGEIHHLYRLQYFSTPKARLSSSNASAAYDSVLRWIMTTIKSPVHTCDPMRCRQGMSPRQSSSFTGPHTVRLSVQQHQDASIREVPLCFLFDLGLTAFCLFAHVLRCSRDDLATTTTNMRQAYLLCFKLDCLCQIQIPARREVINTPSPCLNHVLSKTAPLQVGPI